MPHTSHHPTQRRADGADADLPRIIVWQVAPGGADRPAGGEADPSSRRGEPLNMSECMLIVDSIARTAKPILVLTGDRIPERFPRLPELIEYGRALGLKLIVEVTPGELTEEILEAYAHFGERIFRVRVTDAIAGASDGRLEESPGFAGLEEVLDRLTRAGYESHLVYTATRPDLRILARIHDFAVRRSARGLYCHLRFDLGNGSVRRDGEEVDDFVRRFATMKEYSPPSMIISPQCVKFTHRSRGPGQGPEGVRTWEYTCLAGRSYAFIDETGSVHLCGGSGGSGASLRDSSYDFRKVWHQSPAFTAARHDCRNCRHGYHTVRPAAPVPE